MENNDLNFDTRVDLEKLKNAVTQIKSELGKIIVGQEDFIDLLIVALLADGHVLIEGVPGVAKTITAKLLSKTINTGFSRLQFTPDLMPSDVLGTSILNMKTSEFEFKKGPIFSNLVLIDEINRAPAKTQAALFEVMEERQISIDGNTYKMKPPYRLDLRLFKEQLVNDAIQFPGVERTGDWSVSYTHNDLMEVISVFRWLY